MGTSSTIMNLLLNCQGFKCICDFINKYNDVIDFIVFLFLIAFAFYMAKKKTTGIKPCILVCTNFLALIFSIAALCMTHPNQLGFDYIGAIVGILALLVTVLIGWNIYQLVDVKGIRKDFEAYKEDVKADINRHLLLEETTLAVEYSKARDWEKAFTIMGLMAHRYEQLLRRVADIDDISTFVNSVAWAINELDDDEFKEVEYKLDGLMAILSKLPDNNKKIADLCQKYNERKSNTHEMPPYMNLFGYEVPKERMKYAVQVYNGKQTLYVCMAESPTSKYELKDEIFKNATLFSTSKSALTAYNDAIQSYEDKSNLSNPLIIQTISSV